MLKKNIFKISLIGDSCLDEYVYGSCTRLNPEAPVPVLNYDDKKIVPGMCLNVKENLLAFNVDVTTLTNKEQIIKTRYIDKRSNQQILRVDQECEIEPIDISKINFDCDALVISDYDKGFINKKDLNRIIKKAKCPVFIDSKKTELPSKNCFIKINDIEYKKLSNPSDNIIVTRGGKGAIYKGVNYPGQKVKVYDVIGAGDTFLATLVYFYLMYGKIETAIPYANKAAAIAVSNPGTYVLTENDIKEILK